MGLISVPKHKSALIYLWLDKLNKRITKMEYVIPM
jgi:hypothetical protein